MPDKPKTDTVMKFTDKDGKKIKAECALDKDPLDAFMIDFSPATYKDYSDFFEVKKFGFGFKVSDKDRTKKNTQGGATAGTPSHGTSSRDPMTETKNKRAAGEFANWRTASYADAIKMDFPLQFEAFHFERLIDAASPVFFEYCVGSISFQKAVLVRRLSVGNEQTPLGFLRMTFGNVLITKIDWDDGDLTTEKCEFICRSFKLQYRQQDPDGGWSAAYSAEWDYKKDAYKPSQ